MIRRKKDGATTKKNDPVKFGLVSTFLAFTSIDGGAEMIWLLVPESIFMSSLNLRNDSQVGAALLTFGINADATVASTIFYGVDLHEVNSWC